MVIVRDDKAAEDKEEADPDKTFLENVRVKNRADDVAVRGKHHEGEEKTQGCERIDHEFRGNAADTAIIIMVCF